MPIKCNPECKAQCCRHVNSFSFMKDYDRGDGVCKHLDAENRCDIYDHRPPICNTDLMFERVYSRFMSREEYDKMNEESCKVLFKNFSQN